MIVLSTTTPLPLVGEGDFIFTVIFFVIVAIISGIGSLLKKVNSKAEQARRERVRQELEAARANAPDWTQIARQAPPVPPPARNAPPMPVRLPPGPAPQRRQTPVPPRVPPAIPKQKQQKKQKKKQPAPPPPVPTAQPTLEYDTSPRVTAPAAVQQRQASAGPAISANQLRSWLRPATLQQQFILTEILQPPLALRPTRDQ